MYNNDKYLETYDEFNDFDDFLEDDMDFMSDEGPSEASLNKIKAEESEKKRRNSIEHSFYIGVSERLDTSHFTEEQIKDLPKVKTYTDLKTGLRFPKLTCEQRNSLLFTNPLFYQVRKQIYAFNKERKSPIISGDKDYIVCPHCHEKHYLKDMYLKETPEILSASDVIYYLSGGLFDFVTHCNGCNKFLYGYKEEPKVEDWFLELMSDPLVKGKKKSKKKDKNNSVELEEVTFGEQLSLFDLDEFLNQSNTETVKTSKNEVNTVTVSVENIPTIAEKMAAVAQLNEELNAICDEVYSNSTYAEKISSFGTLKMKELINEAKSRDGIQNFMRMNKREIISCLILFDDNVLETLNPLLEKVKERTAWLYGKYKDIT